jgi:NADPH-dependent 2,4-dienoyl-CoA reductase/sulfur reductase-like enzyme
MPYYIGDVIKDEKRMIARTPEQFAKTGVDVKLKTRVEEIDSEKGTVRLSTGETMPYDVLVMATGSDAFVPDIPGIDMDGVFKLKNLTDAIRIKSFIKEAGCRKAAVVGAGFIAMEMSDILAGVGIETQIVYRGERPIRKWAPEFSEMVLEEITQNKVAFLPYRLPVAVDKGEGKSRLRLFTDDGPVDADLIIFALGVNPSIQLAQEIGLELGSSGAIKVNFAQNTSRDQVYAVGDCSEVFHRVCGGWVYMPLGDVANKQGRVAGHNIGNHPMTFPGIVGAQSFKVFNLDVAITGLDEEEAARCGYHAVSTTIKGTPIARSMNKGEKLSLKLIADKYSGKLLGAQAAGNGGAVSRINTLSACLWTGMNLDDIGYIDLAYSPPHGGPWDPIHIAAQSLRRKL